jgi:prepilin signal peptidase PulO-like enzyme (type II secretory pathway)
MEILIYFSIFIFGLVVGSFLNCVIYRLETGESFLKGRSYCPHCEHVLSWKDLIPIFSFLILKGKCRYCKKKISLQYPLVELFTGILFAFTTYNLQPTTPQETIILAFQLFVVSCLVIIFVFDLKHYLIPDKIIYPAITIAFLNRILTSNIEHLTLTSNIEHLTSNLILGIFPSLFFLAIILISHETWMGLGDFKLSILMGIFLTWPKILVALFFAFFSGAAVGLFLIFLKRKTMKSQIPFAPFLVSGTFFAMFFGNEIIDWYLNLFLL